MVDLIEQPPVFWAEVYSRSDQRWIPVDPVRGTIRRKGDYEPTSDNGPVRMTYVVAYEEGQSCFRNPKGPTDGQMGMLEMSHNDIQRTLVPRRLNYVHHNVKMSQIGGMRLWISYADLSV